MIYLVEDDANIRELVVYTLCSTGFEAQGFERPSLFFKALETSIPDLVLLDIMLPEENGLSILSKLKASSKTRDIPIIMLTAKGTEIDKVKGLDTGADDYLTKPFGVMELIARVKALIRRTMPEEDNKFLRYHELFMDNEKHRVYVSDELVEFITIQGVLISFEAIRCEYRFHIKEAEPSSESIVDHSKATIRCIHHADEIKILWN